MKLTLRKANAVQNSINDMLKELDLSTEVAINEFEKPSDKIAEAGNKFATHLATRNKLLGALYEIRRAVAQANAEAGINDMLADVAMLEKQLSFYNSLAKLAPQLDIEVIRGKLGKIKSREGSDIYGRYGEDEIRTSIFTQGEVDSFRNTANDYRRQKQKLQDALLELNVQTEIDLNEDTVLFLEKADIL